MSQAVDYLSVFVVIALVHAVWIGSLIGLAGIAFRPRRVVLAGNKSRHLNSAYSANLLLLVSLTLSIPLAGVLAWATVASFDVRPPHLADVEASNDGPIPASSTQAPDQSLQNLQNFTEDAFAISLASSGTQESDTRPAPENTGGSLIGPKAELSGSSFAQLLQVVLGRRLWSQLVFIAPWIAAAYFIGAVLMFGRVGAMLIGSQRIMQRAQQVQDSRILNMFNELSHRLGLAIVPVLATTNRILSPVVVGIWRPMVLVPSSLITGLTIQELEMILVHELSHIRRHDQLVVMLQRIVEAILFFHPTTWYLSLRLNHEREIRCDDAVLAMGSSPLAYANSLCRVAEIALSLKPTKRGIGLIDPISIAATGTSDSQLVYRVRRMLGEAGCSLTTPAVTIPRMAGASFLAISVMLTACLGWYSWPESANSPAENAALTTLPVALSDASNQDDDSTLNYVPDVLIAGVVVDKNDNPVAGAVVWAQPRKHRFEAVSGANGEFELKVPKSVVSGLLIQAKTDDPTIRGSGRIPWENSDEISSALKIVVEPAKRITINVVDGTNKPLPGIDVGAIGSHRILDVSRTEQNGNAEILTPSNMDTEYVYAFSNELGLDYRAFVLPREDRLKSDAQKPALPDGPIQLRLDGVQAFSVVVMDDSSEPLADADVYPFLLSKVGEPEALNLSTIKSQIGLVGELTDASGVATINWIPSWEKGIVSFHASRSQYSFGSVNFDPKDGDHDLAIHLTRKIPVQGRVALLDGSPVKDAEIRFHGYGRKSGESFGTGSAAVVFTDNSGQFEFLAEPCQVYLGQLQSESLAFATSTVFAIAYQPLKEPLKFTVRPPTKLHGRVTFGSNNEPIVDMPIGLTFTDSGEVPVLGGPGIQIASPQIADIVQTNSNGEFEFRVGFGKYRIHSNSDDTTVEFEIGDEADKEINFHSPNPPKSTLTGSVVTQGNSEQVPNAIITGLYIDSEATGSLPSISGKGLATDLEGKFSIERKWFPVLLCARSADGKLGGFAEVAADKANVTIAISPVKSVIGRLIDAKTGLPMPQREVVCKRRFAQESGSFLTTFHVSAETNDDGIFKVDEIMADAKYDLSLTLEKKNGHAMHSFSLGDFTIDPDLEQLDLGDVKFKPREDGPLPTSRDRAARSFGVAGLPVERFGNAQAWAKINRQQIMVVFGDPDSELVEQLWGFRFDDDQISTAFQDFMILAIPTGGKQIERANVLVDTLDLKLDLNGQDFQIAILDQDAKLISSILSSALLDENGVELSVSSVARMLKEHGLVAWDGRKMLDDALAVAKRDNKRVLVEETATWCSPCLLLSLYLERTREIWSKDYVWVKMDHRWTGAMEIMSALRGEAAGGIPWFAILDSEGKPLITSNDEKGNNLGFPTTTGDLEHFKKMIKQTSIRLTEEDIEKLMLELANSQESTSLIPKSVRQN